MNTKLARLSVKGEKKAYRINEYEYALLQQIKDHELLSTDTEVVRMAIREAAQHRGIHTPANAEEMFTLLKELRCFTTEHHITHKRDCAYWETKNTCDCGLGSTINALTRFFDNMRI